MNDTSNRSTPSNATHLLGGIAALLGGLVVVAFGQAALGPAEVHPIATGLFAVGTVATGVGLASRLTNH